MSAPTFSKKAYARGIGNQLQARGILQLPSPRLLKEACDVVARGISVDPAQEAVPTRDCIKLAEALVSYNNSLRSQGKTASYPQEALINHSVDSAIGDLLEKIASAALAEQTGDHNTAIRGDGQHENTLEAAADESEMGAQELHRRPSGYAMVGQGNANFSEPAAARRGLEIPHPDQFAHEGAASNSAVDASKSASANALNRLLRKLAEGGEHDTAVNGDGRHANTLEAAADESEMGAQETKRRPSGYAIIEQGGGNLDEPEAARRGTEQDHPGQEDHDGASSNSAVDASKTSSVSPWERHFRHTASQIEPYFPANMSMSQRYDTVKQAMSLEPSEFSQLFRTIKEAARRKAAPAPTINSLLHSLNILNH